MQSTASGWSPDTSPSLACSVWSLDTTTITETADEDTDLTGVCMQVPIVIRDPGGVGRQLGAEHSQRLKFYFQSTPGVQLVAAMMQSRHCCHEHRPDR